MKKKQHPVPAKRASLPSGFADLLADVKLRIQQAQTRAVQAVNAELLHLYWDIGCMIDRRQQQEGWGSGVIRRLSAELKNELPELKGFSERNLKLMVQFAHEYPDAFPSQEAIGQPPVAQLESTEIRQPLVAQIPWAHNVLLMQRVKDPAARQWYMQQTLANGWSRNVLAMSIDSDAHWRRDTRSKLNSCSLSGNPIPLCFLDFCLRLSRDSECHSDLWELQRVQESRRRT